MSEKILEVKHLGKAFGSNQVLRDIDFSVSPGDVTCIIGPSGSGKSTLLRCLNMLETPSTGEINYHGTDITSKNVNVPEYRSKVGMVFQNFNLFPHFSVIKNITDAPIKVQKRDKKELGISAVRGGTIVGEHEVIFAGPDEVIEFKHTAYSKSVFAKGSIEAAKFLAGKPAGYYDMRDVIAAKQ